MSVHVEIICVGNELLIGKTLNTNAHWLAKRVTSLGGAVKRMTIVGDEVGEIANAIREAVQRRPKFVITTGGLGPTFDDKTLEGIAKSLNLGLKVNEKALKMIREKYEAYLREGKLEKVELTPSRVKMATLPEGTEPLHNPVGTAPGIIAKVKDLFLIALPGVPPEMEAIFEESVAFIIKKEAGRSAFFEASVYANDIMESNLAPLIDRAMHDNPHVYIKSHVYTKHYPQTEGQQPHIELHFSTTSDNPRTAKTQLNNAIARLSELVLKNGGKIRTKANLGERR